MGQFFQVPEPEAGGHSGAPPAFERADHANIPQTPLTLHTGLALRGRPGPAWPGSRRGFLQQGLSPWPLCGLGVSLLMPAWEGPAFTACVQPPSHVCYGQGAGLKPRAMGQIQKLALTSFLFPGAHFLSHSACSFAPFFGPCIFPSVSGPKRTLGLGCHASEWWPAPAPGEAPKDGGIHRGCSPPSP